MYLVIALLLSLLIGLSLGMLGGGGSILTVPILVYALGLPAPEAIASSLIVVGITSATGAARHARSGNVEWRTGLVFGAAGMAGAFLGGRAAGWFSDRTLLLSFAAIMVVTAVAMFRGRRERPEASPPASKLRLAVYGSIVGVVTGWVGAGGGFLVVPALALAGGLPMRRAVGTSLLVIAANSVAGFLGRVGDVTIDVPLTAAVTAAAVVGSLAGGALADRLPQETLRKGFALFVLVLAVFQIWQEL